MAKLGRWERDRKACRAEHIYYLALESNRVPPPALDYECLRQDPIRFFGDPKTLAECPVGTRCSMNCIEQARKELCEDRVA